MLSKSKYLITTSLLNSWLYLYKQDTPDMESFLKTLSRIKEPPNEFMLKGIEFENSCYDLKVDFMNKYVKNSEIQMKGYKEIKVGDTNYLVYGICDLLKASVIYDIKRVIKYEAPKYQWSSQHIIYFYLFDNTETFKYLIVDDELNLHIESYFRSDFNIEERLKTLIRDFISFLKSKNLLNLYKEKWQTKY